MFLRALGKIVLKIFLWFALVSIVISVIFRWLPIPITGVIIERQISALIAKKDIPFKKDWVSIDDISPALPLAVMAAEDQKFLAHNGFDWNSISKAAKHNLNNRRTRGGSTLSQQTAKNVFLWSDRSWLRKGLEAWFTVLIENIWSKQRIMEAYVNSVEFGTGIYGAEAASQHYFGKSAKHINTHEAALLAAVLPNPHKYSVKQPSAYVRQRQQWIIVHMNKLGGTALIKQLNESN